MSTSLKIFTVSCLLFGNLALAETKPAGGQKTTVPYNRLPFAAMMRMTQRQQTINSLNAHMDERNKILSALSSLDKRRKEIAESKSPVLIQSTKQTERDLRKRLGVVDKEISKFEKELKKKN
ncbi:hypothetical protein ACES2L_14360 [Bdellovibrio bacteriovorus]